MATDSELKIGYQGAPGAFSHRAVKIFAEDLNRLEDVTPVSCKTFDEVFARILSGECSHGVIPLENSSVGSIVANYDLLWKNKVEMVGEIYLPIHHNLIGFSDTDISKLVEVYSHPVALDQCRTFLKELTGAKAVSYWDTSRRQAVELSVPSLASLLQSKPVFLSCVATSKITAAIALASA